MFNNTPFSSWKHNIEYDLPIASTQKQHLLWLSRILKKILNTGVVDSNDDNNYMYAPISEFKVNNTLIQQQN